MQHFFQSPFQGLPRGETQGPGACISRIPGGHLQQEPTVPEPFPAIQESGYVLVAAFLLYLPDGSVQHVKQRIVPVQDQGGHGAKPHPQIASANMVQLVEQQALERFRV